MICIIFTELLSLGIMYFCFENENIKSRQKVITKANMKSVNFQVLILIFKIEIFFKILVEMMVSH